MQLQARVLLTMVSCWPLQEVNHQKNITEECWEIAKWINSYILYLENKYCLSSWIKLGIPRTSWKRSFSARFDISHTQVRAHTRTHSHSNAHTHALMHSCQPSLLVSKPGGAPWCTGVLSIHGSSDLPWLLWEFIS